MYKYPQEKNKMQTFKPDELSQVMAEQNPWHQSPLGSVPEALAPHNERPLAQNLWKRLLLEGGFSSRFHLILGPRLVGKTTVLYQTVRHLLKAGVEPSRICYLRLDHPRLVGVDLDELVRTVIQIAPAPVNANNHIYLMLDEVVYNEYWDLGLKTFHDERWPVSIVATSSVAAVSGERPHDASIGRWIEHHLSPVMLHDLTELAECSFDLNVPVGKRLGETLRSYPSGHRADPNLSYFRNLLMLQGGFPQILSALPRFDDESNHEANFLFSQKKLRVNAIEGTIYKEIPQSFSVGNPMMLHRLLYTLAQQFTGLLSFSNISRKLGISQATLKRYISYLEQSFIVFAVPNYSGRHGGRKLYFVDGAVRNATLMREKSTLVGTDEQDQLIENMAATSLRNLSEVSSVPSLWHWHQDNHHVDLVFDDPLDPLAFVIASNPDSSHQQGLAVFVERYKKFEGRCYIVSPNSVVRQALPESTNIGSLPLDTFLISVGAQSSLALTCY